MTDPLEPLSTDPNDFIFADVETRSFEDVTVHGAARHAARGRVVIFTYAIGEGEVKDWCIPTFEPGLKLDWADAPEDLLDALQEVEEGRKWFVAWNSGFEMQAFTRAMTGLETFRPEWMIDAMIQAMVSHLPPDLKGASKAVGLTQKQAAGKRLIKLFSDESGEATPQSHPEDWQMFREYARDDVAATRDIFFATMPLPRRSWQEFWSVEKINARGVPVDVEFVQQAVTLSEKLTVTSNADILRLTGGKVRTVNQSAALLGWIRYELRALPEVDRILTREVDLVEDEDGEMHTVPKHSLGRTHVEELIAYLERVDEDQGLTDEEWAVLQVLEVRLYGASATPKKYKKIMSVVDGDRLKGSYVFNGAAATGRMSGRGVQCVTGDHDVLTRDGWVPIRDAVGSREIMAWCSTTNALKWSVAEINAFGPAPVAKVDSTIVKGVYTWDHRIPQIPWKSLRDTNLREIAGGRRASKCIVSAPVDQPDAPFTDAQLKLLAAMQSDGTWSRRAARWHFSKERKVERLKTLLSATGIPFSFTQYTNGNYDVRIKTADVPPWLVKDFDVWLLRLSARQAALVLDEYAVWDGWRHPKNGVLNVSSPRKDQLEWLAVLGALAGRTSTLASYITKTKNIARYESWRFYLRGSKTTTVMPCQVFDAGVQDVFCPTVPSGYWLCRYDDRIYITGNTQNLTRATIGSLDDEAEAIEMIAERGAECFDDLRGRWGPVGRTLSRLIRPSFVAPEGKHFVWCDWSAIEARVLPWIANSEGGDEILDVFRQNDLDPSQPDIYKQAAGRILSKPAEDVTKAERQSHGKIPTLALGFGGGKGALFAMARAYGASFTEDEAQGIVDGWRGTNKWAVRLWDQIWDSVLWCMENPGMPREAGRMTYVFDAGYMRGSLFAILPCGRPLVYPGLRWQEVEQKNKQTGEISSRMSLTVRQARARVPLSHLTLTNNAVQGTAASLLRDTLVKVEDEPLLETVLVTHDEVICLTDAKRLDAAKDRLMHIMLDAPAWAEGLPVAAEATTGEWYSKASES